MRGKSGVVTKSEDGPKPVKPGHRPSQKSKSTQKSKKHAGSDRSKND